jgi:DNA polymerase-3 subunit alpha
MTNGSQSVPFVHLHNHSEYSVLDGMCRVEDMVSRAAEFGMGALALTDHGNMFGAVTFYQACQRRGIVPVIGCEVYLAPGSRHDRDASQKVRHHLILLCADDAGYRNLVKLTSLAHTEGFYYKPRIDKEILEKHSGGLICLSACLSGEIPRLLQKDDYARAKEAAGWYAEVFGRDNFFLELMFHGLDVERKVNHGLLSLARELGLGTVATNDCHYLDHADHLAHEVLLCIQTGKTLSDPDHMRFPTDQFYFKSPREMGKTFEELPGALAASVEIAKRCHLYLELDPLGGKLPSYPVPDTYADEGAYLLELATEKLRECCPNRTDRYEKRLGEELDIINAMRFPGYFLIVWDIVRQARSMGVEVGPGRGSAAGSLVAYVLGITDIDPLEYGLLFERFLNPERVTMPDIDLDFADDQREQVIEYVKNKYGEKNVAQLITFSRLGARAVIRDVGRVLGVPLEAVDRVAKLVPYGPGVTLKGALETTPELQQAQNEGQLIPEVLNYGQSLEGLVRHAGTHAAGVVISDRPLDELVPLYTGNTTQYDGGSVEKVGLLKIDFLGLKNLSVIRDCLALVRERHGMEIKPEDIELDDPKTYDLLKRCDTAGVFQLESEIARDVLRRVAPDNFRELIPVLSLFRPGPLGSGMTETYIRGKHGTAPINYPHPTLEDVLGESFGVMVYQEQVMQVASTLAGFTYGRADLLRRAMSKKTGELDSFREEFVHGATEKGIEAKLAAQVFDQIIPFASYGFNKSHSAAYAVVTYRTAWLKANYRPEFMAALLSHELGDEDKIAYYLGQCRRDGLEILPPDLHKSSKSFTVEESNGGTSIRFGLGAVKNVGLGVVELIIADRAQNGPFTSLKDLALRLGTQQINKRVLESLVKCGAVDGMPGTRSQKYDAVELILEAVASEQRDRQIGQESFFGGRTGERPGDPLDESLEPWSEHEKMGGEKETLGLYLSGHPLTRYRRVIERFATSNLARIQELQGGESVRVAGVFTHITRKLDRNSQRIAFANLEDESAAAEVAIFAETYARYRELIAKDRVVLVVGQAQTSRDEINIRANAIYELSQVPRLLARQLHLELLGAGLTEQNLTPIRTLLGEYPGELEVYLHLRLTGNSVTLRAGPAYMAAPDGELVRRLEDLVGEGNAYFTPAPELELTR